MADLVGNAGKPRIIATFLDTIIAAIPILVLGPLLASLSEPALALVLISLYFGYFLLTEALWARTLGKAICGLVITRIDGGPAGWREAGTRTLLRIIEVNPILLGALPAGLTVMWSRRRQRLGDMLAGTLVVSTSSKDHRYLPEAENRSDLVDENSV